MAGFRLQETVLFFIHDDVVGRGHGVSGAAVISHNEVTHATVRVKLTTIKIAGKTQPQLAQSLHTQWHPIAVVRLDKAHPAEPRVRLR